MLFTDPREFTFNGEKAQLVIVRNNGFCWGEVKTASGTRWAVDPEADVYDEEDDCAAELIMDAAQHMRNVHESLVSADFFDAGGL